jgi:hypothetical protein
MIIFLGLKNQIITFFWKADGFMTITFRRNFPASNEMRGGHWKKLTYDREGKPKQKFFQGLQKIFRISTQVFSKKQAKSL